MGLRSGGRNRRMARKPKGKMMKTFLKIVLWLVIVLAVLLGAAVLFMDHVLPKTFNTAVPKVLGVDASMESAKVRLWRGYVSLHGLHIGNPEGFKTSGIFDLGEATGSQHGAY